MRSLFPTLALSGFICAVSESALASITRGAPGPEIGDGVVGVVVATVAVLTFVMLPRLRKSLQSKKG